MPSNSVLLIAFALQLVIHLINTVGASTIDALLWTLYTYLPTPTSKQAAEHRLLQAEFLRLRKELNGTSSQDQFAKWAKIRRQHDKVLEQLEKSKASMQGTKSSFDRYIGALRWLSTTGLRWLVQLYYAKQPMFWLPAGWLPYYAEFMISLPRAPLGSVSIQAWLLACAAVISLVWDAGVGVVDLVRAAKSKNGKTKEKTKEKPFGGRLEEKDEQRQKKEL